MTTTPSILPCVCGGSAEMMRRLITRKFFLTTRKFFVRCDRAICRAATSYFADKPTAIRVWNSMQQAAQSDCVGTVPLRWDKDDLMLGDINIGTIEREYHGAAGAKVYSQTRDEDEPRFCSDLYAEADEAAARAALVAYVMGENGL